MESVWASASFASTRTVLRLKLRPYSCGHEILLGLIRSPIVVGGPVDWHDLLVASLICSQTFNDGLSYVHNPKRIRFFAFIWRLFLRRLNLVAELKEFQTYLKEGCWTPDSHTVVAGVDVRELKAPRVYRMVPFICSRLGLTEEQAFDFPMARAAAYYAAESDKAGEIDLVGKGDIDRRKKLDAYKADLVEREKRGEAVWDF